MTQDAVTSAGTSDRLDTENRLKSELFEIAGGIWSHLLRRAEERLRLEMALERQVIAKDRAILAKLVATNARARERQAQAPSPSSLLRRVDRVSQKVALAERELADAMPELMAHRQVVERLQRELSECEARLARAMHQESSGD
jgi:hypothetical protein